MKRIIPNLIEWSTEEGKDHSQLNELYGQVFGQFNRYMGHVTSNLGGVYEFQKTGDEEGAIYMHVSKEKQAEAMAFLNEQLFSTPSWMVDQEIISKTRQSGIVEQIRGLQTRTLNRIFEGERMLRIIENETLNGADAYSLSEVFSDATNGIFSEISDGSSPDTYRRNLQRAFIERMGTVMMEKDAKFKHSDINAMARGTLKKLKASIEEASSNEESIQFHYDDLVNRIDNILDPNN